LGGVLECGLAGNPGEEAGDESVGELAEAEMDLLFQGSKTGGILGELFSPQLLLLSQLSVDVLQRLLGWWNGVPGLRAKTKEHRPFSLTLLSHLSFYPRGSSAALFG
jgi:hypothetical protein